METIARNGIDQSRKFAVLCETPRNKSFLVSTFPTQQAAEHVAKRHTEQGAKNCRVAAIAD